MFSSRLKNRILYLSSLFIHEWFSSEPPSHKEKQTPLFSPLQQGLRYKKPHVCIVFFHSLTDSYLECFQYFAILTMYTQGTFLHLFLVMNTHIHTLLLSTDIFNNYHLQWLNAWLVPLASVSTALLFCCLVIDMRSKYYFYLVTFSTLWMIETEEQENEIYQKMCRVENSR